MAPAHRLGHSILLLFLAERKERENIIWRKPSPLLDHGREHVDCSG